MKYGKSINSKAPKQPDSRIISPLEIVVESSNSRVNNNVRKIQEKLKRVLQIIYQLSFKQSEHEQHHKNEFCNDERDVSPPGCFRLGSQASIAAPNIQIKHLEIADIRQISPSLFKSLPRESELVKYIELIKAYLVERNIYQRSKIINQLNCVEQGLLADKVKKSKRAKAKKYVKTLFDTYKKL
ncbi:unnamed protein product [Moneuplotes crassus]|uniref:Uncharacterized protein n=1 Tax=Euplotes crassus TaxID=5936 RepID=A0AAD1X625_EUPCR|nr:unnamed protein product [Moneuplotes crassus]